MSQPTIGGLPPEMILQIFRHLQLNDLVRIKRVCSLWNELIGTMKIERLFVSLNLDAKERWYYSSRPCRTVEFCHPRLFIAQCKKPILSNLKYLKFNTDIAIWNIGSSVDFDLNEVNTFSGLVQLEMAFSCGNLNLNLPNLEVLSLDPGNYLYEIHLNCRRLRVLSYGEAYDKDLLRVEHPDSVRVLESQMYGARLARFRHLECLRRTSFQFGFLDVTTMLKLKKLKAFHYDHSIDAFVNNDFDKIKRILKNFMQQKRMAGRSALKFYFAGLQLIDEKLDDIDFCLETRNGRDFIAAERLYTKHYDRLQDELEFVQEVNYSRLFRLVDGLPADYFRRFCNLRMVTAECPLNEQHLLDFLKRVNWLRWLTLYGLASQAFFDSLPHFFSLSHFYLYAQTDKQIDRDTEHNRPENQEIELDFSFLGKFEKLNRFEIERSLSLESARTLISAFQSLTRLHSRAMPFRFKGTDYRVLRNRPELNKPTDRFNLVSGEFTLLRAVSLAEIFDYVRLL